MTQTLGWSAASDNLMKLSTGHRRLVYWSGAGLFASGALWLVFHYFVRTQGQFGDTAHPLEIWWLRLHGASAMLVLVVVGSLLPVHMRRGWHQRKNLFAGCVLATLELWLIASGYALYYIEIGRTSGRERGWR